MNRRGKRTRLALGQTVADLLGFGFQVWEGLLQRRVRRFRRRLGPAKRRPHFGKELFFWCSIGEIISRLFQLRFHR